jgi:predicted enzyme related to lactoylglutathione lyase
MAGDRPTFFGPMLIVPDFRSALAFYRDILGLEGDGASPYVEFASNSCKLVLLDHSFWTSMGGSGGPSPTIGKREGVVLALQVTDVDAEYRRRKATGIAIASMPTDRPRMGLRNFQVYEPDGNLVELTSPLTRAAVTS